MNHTPGVEYHSEHAKPPQFWRSRYGIGSLVLGAIAAYFLLSEHLAHVVEALPLILLLACPLMHEFMCHAHGGHGQHHHGDASSEAVSGKSTPPQLGDRS